jgi:hypothetical protein
MGEAIANSFTWGCRVTNHEGWILFNQDFRLPPRCWWALHSSGILRGAVWQFFTDVSVPSSRIKGPRRKGLLTPWRWDRYLVPKRRQRNTTRRRVISQKSAYFPPFLQTRLCALGPKWPYTYSYVGGWHSYSWRFCIKLNGDLASVSNCR